MSDRISEETLQKVNETLENGGVQGMLNYLRGNLDEWKTVPLRIALLGESAVGKSTFINCIRGLTADDEGGAKVGQGDTTVEPKSYPHPSNSNIVFWDLPGVGTTKFPREEYLSKIDLEKYDFMIIFSADRFTANDAWLAKEVREQGKTFFFVRTKIDEDLENAGYDRGSQYDECKVIQDIKENCQKNLGCDMSTIYVIDNYSTDKWDFPRLQEDIVSALPEQKRQALLLTLGPLSKKVIQMKADALRARVWIVATVAAVVSGAASAIPFVGIVASATLDVGVLVEEVSNYISQFGLNRESLGRISRQSNIPVEVLAKCLQTVSLSITPKAVAILIRTALSEVTEAAVSQATKVVVGLVLPVVGAAVSGALSFGSAVFTLRSFIEKLQRDAEAIADKVLAEAVSTS